MKYAKSIFLADLVDATDAKYSDYFNKGIICPFCLEKVFFAKAFDRVIDGQNIKVSASFRHHKGDPLECEARSQSTEGKRLLSIISGESKKQRKELWSKYLWAMFCEGIPYIESYATPYTEAILKTRLDRPMNCNYRLPRSMVNLPLNFVSSVIASLVLSFTLSEFYSVDILDPEKEKRQIPWQEYFTDRIRPRINEALATTPQKFSIDTPLPVHHSICLEVVQELVKRENEYLLIRISAIILILLPDHLIPELITVLKVFERGIPSNADSELASHLSFIENIFGLFSGLISAIDWYQLSQRPWKQLIKSYQKMLSHTKGKGFA